MPLRFSPFVRLSICSLGLVSSVLGTSVRPPNLDELVVLADTAMAGTVVAVRSEWRESAAGRSIHTMVTLRVDDPIIIDATGDALTEIELDFLGGTVGERSLIVVGQPQFKVGDRELLFVTRNGQQVSPLVRMAYGRYRLVPDATDPSVLRVLRENHQPLTDTGAISQPLEHQAAADRTTAGSSAALSYSALREQIVLRALAHQRNVGALRLP